MYEKRNYLALNYGWKSLSWHKIGDQTSFSDIEVVVWRKRTQETEYHFCLNKIQVICRKLLSTTCFVCMIIYIRDIFWHPFIDLSIFGQNWSVSNLYIHRGPEKLFLCSLFILYMLHTNYLTKLILPKMCEYFFRMRLFGYMKRKFIEWKVSQDKSLIFGLCLLVRSPKWLVGHA